ncbi:MAG: type II secretion system GspH family protein, partial [Puniceicoccales bacterium]|nr:type II secretion system GspH family protein [Puniceicoccales bacterium]
MKRRAFTLLEVVVALGIFSMMAAVLLEAVIQVEEALAETLETGGREEAKSFVLRRVLAATSRDAVSGGGSFALENGASVSWSVSLEETTVPDLHLVTLSLEWASNDAEEVRLWAYRPEWSDPDTRSSL